MDNRKLGRPLYLEIVVSLEEYYFPEEVNMQDISKDEALIKAKSEYDLLQEEIQKLQAEIASLMKLKEEKNSRKLL